MISFQEYRRRATIPILGLALGLYYVLVFLPLSHKAHDLDEPLRTGWRALANAVGQSNSVALDFRQITNQLSLTREGLALLEMAKRKAAARLELSAQLRNKLTAPFQLLEFQNERSKQQDALSSLAAKSKVTLDPAVLVGYPEYTVRVKQPELLWAALYMVNGLLTTAVQCQVTAIEDVEVPLITGGPAASGSGMSIAEIPFKMELAGTATSIERFLETLPLRADELKAAGLTEPPPDRPPVFIARLVLKKQNPEKPDEVHLSLELLGYVLRE